MTRRLAVGIDLGGSNIRVALGDEDGRILKKLVDKTEKTKGPEGVSRQIIRMVRSIQTKIMQIEKVEGIGIGSMGPLDLKKGGLMKPTNIPYDFVPLVEPLVDEFGLQVRLLNDCAAAVVGEKFYGVGVGCENLVYITLSTGIGGGVYVDNHLLVGKDGNAHEIGHFTIDYEGLLLCPCGKRGHWEAYCSGNGIPSYIKLLLKEKKKEELRDSLLIKAVRGDLEKITAKILYESANASDQISKEIVEKIGVLNAIGFASVTDAYDPVLITVGGAITLNNPRLVIDPIKQYVGEHARNCVPKVDITPLGDDIALYGALAMVFANGNV